MPRPREEHAKDGERAEEAPEWDAAVGKDALPERQLPEVPGRHRL